MGVGAYACECEYHHGRECCVGVTVNVNEYERMSVDMRVSMTVSV